MPIVVVGVGLPVGLVALFLAAKGNAADGAVAHGELYLSGGNAAFVGCVALFARHGKNRRNALIATLYVLMVLVVPSYAMWAFFATETILSESYSGVVAVQGGLVSAVGGALAGLTLICISQRSR